MNLRNPNTCRAVFASAIFVTALSSFAAPTISSGPTEKLLGEWRGRSLCAMASRPACTDETVLYRINAAADSGFDIEMNKIVAGETQFMVKLECRFEETRQQLLCPVVAGQWQFRWDGNMLLGGLIDHGQVSIVRFATVRKSQ